VLHLVHLTDLQQPLRQDMLEGAPCVLRFAMNEKRGLTAEAEIEIRNPGISFLQASNYVAVVETDDRDGLLANGRVLCRARVAKVPSDVRATTLVLPLTCAPASHKEDLRAAANAACAGAAIPPWQVRIVPQPDPGIVAVAFSGAPGSLASWALMKATAVKVTSFFQEDLVRTPYSRFTWQVVNQANALLRLSLPASAKAAATAAAAAGRFAVIGVSGDNDPTHAAFFTYGKVMRVGPAPGGGVDVEVNLADPSVTGSGFAYAPGDPTKAGLPFYDPLFGGGTDDLSTTALEARSQAWHVDPVTHAISLDELLTGRRLVDLGGLGDEASTEFSIGASPVKHVKLRVVAEWEQRAVGSVDISPVIATAAGPSGYILTLQDRVKEPVGEPKLDFRSWGGWTRGKSSWRSSLGRSAPFPTGRSFTVTYQESIDYPSTTNADGKVLVGRSIKGEPFTVTHMEYGAANIRQVRYNAFWCTYDYQQQRREVADMVLDVDCQSTALGTDTVELPTITLGDLMSVAGVQPFQPNTVYNRGDRVTLFGRVYQCLVDNTVFFYTPVTQRAPGGSSLSVSTSWKATNWQDLGTLAPLADMRAPSFFDSPRGVGCLQHALMRMRAAALRRMEMITISRTYPWELARDVDLRDRVRLLIRDGDTAKPYVGKVVAIDRKIEGQATVKVTIAVPLGTGRADRVADMAGTDYAAADAFGQDYTAVSAPRYLAPSVEGGSVGVFSVNGDVEAVSQADPLVVPVDTYRLQDPFYAVQECFIAWPAQKQLNEARARCAAGKDPRAVTRDYPTELQLGMRIMLTHPAMERFYRVHAALTWSPRGVNLAGGGEP
jgi:hypothetical protein